MRWISAAALAALAASGCGRPEENHVIVPMGSSMSVPPVDREAPARLETATFAVG
ncbi:MAG TPA: hypothetical protein VFC86_11160 [Planctomycetota bacterium]|nr:hypothetical protein [Planctomycetota bacterium]